MQQLSNDFNNILSLSSTRRKICLAIRGPFYMSNNTIKFHECGATAYFYVYEGEKGTYLCDSEPEDEYRFVTVEAGEYGDDFTNAFVYFAYMCPHLRWYEVMLEDVQRRSDEIGPVSTIKFEEFWKWDQWTNEDLGNETEATIIVYWWNGSTFEMQHLFEGYFSNLRIDERGTRRYIFKYSPINGPIGRYIRDMFDVTKRSKKRYLEFP